MQPVGINSVPFHAFAPSFKKPARRITKALRSEAGLERAG